ncbi:endonuclease/exonuclease/phosphatase family protein [Aestuariibius sp. 2305UL40-4]|uniref:endonuclease/exonuclease/phosphatase family protein n=1 Tax=Aestuariibius violaceus TaxID=3234132 RepID=UPI00345EB150
MQIRLATWNIEHFNALFTADNQPTPPDPDKETRYRVTAQEQLDAVALVIQEIDPDILLVIEAPGTTTSGTRDTVTALKNFAADRNLRCSDAAIGFNSSGQQEIALMFDPAKVTVAHDPAGKPLAMTEAALRDLSTEERAQQLPLALDTLRGRKIDTAPRFDTVYPFDSEDDRLLEIYQFTRPPFEARIGLLDGGTEVFTFRMIGAHVKSKGVFDVSDELRDEIKDLSNRRRILAESQWIRDRVDEYLDDGEPVVVAGDFNDGPGLDFYERRFGRSGVELTAGVLGDPDRILRTQTLKPKWSGSSGWTPATASFYQRDTGKFLNALIDFILVSERIYRLADPASDPWRIWNPFRPRSAFEDQPELKAALKDASDHFPVTFDFEVSGSA